MIHVWIDVPTMENEGPLKNLHAKTFLSGRIKDFFSNWHSKYPVVVAVYEMKKLSGSLEIWLGTKNDDGLLFLPWSL